jgi:hypothetical protein
MRLAVAGFMQETLQEMASKKSKKGGTVIYIYVDMYSYGYMYIYMCI